MENPRFIQEKYNLHNSREVKSAVRKTENKTKEKHSQKPKDTIQTYLDRLQTLFVEESENLSVNEKSDNKSKIDKDKARKERALSLIKHFLHKKYLIDPSTAVDAYIKYKKRLIKEKGGGNMEVPENMEQKIKETVVAVTKGQRDIGDALKTLNDEEKQIVEEVVAKLDVQKESLDYWVDYLSSKDADFPDWLKYWSIRSVLSMSDFDKEKKSFKKRTKDSISPFPPLNQQALAKVLESLTLKYGKENLKLKEELKQAKNRLKKIKSLKHQGRDVDANKIKEVEDLIKQKIDKQSRFFKREGINKEEEEETLNNRLAKEKFSKLYAFELDQLVPMNEKKLIFTKGKWVKYNKNSNHIPLVNSIEDFNTGWCTAREPTAKGQLSRGDFYIYYSDYTDEKDPNTTEQIPRVAIHMKNGSIAEVRGIDKDQNLDPYISNVVNEKMKEFPDGEAYQKKSENMRHVTLIDKKVKNKEKLSTQDLHFLYEIDSKIEGFGLNKDSRIKKILSKRKDIKKDLLKTTHYSPNEISLTKEEALSGDIKYHYGNLDLGSLTSAEGLKLPESIKGNLDLSGLISAKGLRLPESIKGNLDLSGLISAKGLRLPESINDSLYLNSLTSAEGLELPESVYSLHLNSLTSAKGLELPESVYSLYLINLTSAEGLELPESVYDLYLNSLTSAEGLELPESVEGDLDLSGLISAEGLELPESVYSLHLNSLTSAEGLKLPESIKGNLNLGSLTSAEGLRLPENINDSLYLNNLTSAEGLELPESVYSLHLNSLTSAKGLELPESVGDYILFNNLALTEKNKLRKKYPQFKIK